MKKKFLVGVREVHLRFYSVIADNPDHAKRLVRDRAAAAHDMEEQEYSHELNPDTWSAKEER